MNNKKTEKFKVVALLLSLSFLLFVVLLVPRGATTVCISEIDCGYDVFGTDRMAVKNYGLPYISRRVETTGTFDVTSRKVTKKSTQVFERKKIAYNVLFWVLLSAVVLTLYRRKQANAHTRH